MEKKVCEFKKEVISNSCSIWNEWSYSSQDAHLYSSAKSGDNQTHKINSMYEGMRHYADSVLLKVRNNWRNYSITRPTIYPLK